MTGEGLTALLTYMEKEGIDPQKHGVEFMRYEPILHGRGLDVSDEGETSVPGLFAAGDLVGNGGCGIALAAYLGWEGGMAAAAQAATVDFQPAEETESIRKRMELPVSYTHLDVYKRQVFPLASFRYPTPPLTLFPSGVAYG